MNKNIFMGGLFLVAFLPSITLAGPIIRTGEQISVDANQELKGDFYGLASKVIISGKSENDAYLGGGTVMVNAPVEGDLTIIGGVVQVHGDAGDDIRAIGGEVTIAKTVKGDVVVFGGTLTILSTATIEGDVLFYGNELTIDGAVIGSVHGTADLVRINSEVGGDVLVTTNSLFTLGSNAHIKGNISYGSSEDMVRAQDAIVIGDVHKTAGVPTDSRQTELKVFIFKILIVAFATICLYFFWRKPVQVVVQTTIARVGLSGLVGLGIAFVVPFISLMLFVSVLGILAGTILLFAYLLLLVVAVVLSPILIGVGIQKVLGKSTPLSLGTIGMGVVGYSLLMFVPYVGGLIIVGSVFVVLGGIGLSIYQNQHAE